MTNLYKIFLCLTTFLVSNLLNATTYYVDADLGNDSNTGFSTANAWQSLSRVNGQFFVPGDSILFKKTAVWYGMLNIEHSGSSTSPITYSNYGTGAKPTIHGQGVVDAVIFVRNSTSYITIDGFSVTNFDGNDVYDGAENLRSGIHVGEWSAQQFGIQILNNEVYFVEGCSNHNAVGSPRGTSLDPDDYNLYQNAGIFCHASKITDLLIQGNYVHDCSCTGINAFLFEEANNLIIRQNSVYNLGGDGIVILNGKSPLIELNSCIDAGNNSGTASPGPGVIGFNGLAVAGIWSHCTDAPVFQYNYCEGTKRIVWDGQPWDFDILTTGDAIYQYNFSRDNEGGFNLGGLPHQLYRYNISYNDGSQQGGGQFFFNGEPTFYNNIFYRDDGDGFMMSDYETQDFKNNIFYSTASTDITYQGDNRTFDNNCYFGHTPVNPGSNALLSNPIFINEVVPGKILPGVFFDREDLLKIVFGYQIHSSSPAIDAGQNISGNGVQDFWENTLYNNTADIGANEYHLAAIKATFCRAGHPITIDGIEELYWQNITSHSLNKQVFGRSDSPGDHQATFKTSWDASHLYFIITVVDESLVNDSNTEPWSDDAIELFIDVGNEKALSYDNNDHQFIIRWNDPDIYEFQGAILQNTNPSGVQKVQQQTPNGYQVEVAISWAALGLTAMANQQIGFEVHVNDDDDGGARDSKIAWHTIVDLSATIPFTFTTIQLDGTNCTGVSSPDICLWMEGPYDSNTSSLRTTLLSKDLLPNINPYRVAPWNYSGTEGQGWVNADYPANSVDWVKVGFRTGVSSATTVASTVAVVQSDGCLVFPDPDALSFVITDSSYYIVVEHRNHLPVMSPTPIAISGNTLTYNFKNENSYTGAGFGQKQISTGVWAMYAGNAEQIMDGTGFDINGSDNTKWLPQNGLFNVYLSGDYNLDGEVTGADKIFWSLNNGLFSGVKR